MKRLVLLVVVAVSHTESEYEGIKAAFEAGFTHTAHFYNGMPGFHKCREYKLIILTRILSRPASTMRLIPSV